MQLFLELFVQIVLTQLPQNISNYQISSLGFC